MLDAQPTTDEKQLDFIMVNFGQVLQRHSAEEADTIKYAYKQAKQALLVWRQESVESLLSNVEDALLGRAIALQNEDTAVLWDDVVEILTRFTAALTKGEKTNEKN